MEYQNNYPVVICHGLMGWGEQDLIDKTFPHFGLTKEKDLCKHLRERGIEVYRPSLGPVNSGWDRACVLWAYLFGGRVDYGKVHSEKYGHARFGKEYPGVLKDLGQTEAHKKINLLGHSFGGPTVKEIVALFVYGSEEERNGTSPEDLSPLFAGGHGGLDLHDILYARYEFCSCDNPRHEILQLHDPAMGAHAGSGRNSRLEVPDSLVAPRCDPGLQQEQDSGFRCARNASRSCSGICQPAPASVAGHLLFCPAGRRHRR